MKRLIILAATLIAGLSACDSLLDKEPLDRVTQFDYFKTRSDLELFSNPFYDNLLDKTPYDEQNDLLVQMTLSDVLYGGDKRTVPNTGGGWSWGNLRRINTLLEYVDQCEDKKAVTEYTALAKFFRAAFYFDKVKRFGDVPWYEVQLGSADEALYKPRDSRELIMTNMIKDIDEAINSGGLTEDISTYRVNKWAALALKARFCLFEGTYRKYHGINLEGHDYTYYLEEAAKAAKTIIDEGPYKLYSTKNPDKDYMMLFAQENASTEEYILAIRNSYEAQVYHNATAYTLLPTQGRPGYTRKFINMYLMKDGKAFTDKFKTEWQTMPFTEEVKDRDPRLAQSIRTPGYKRIGAKRVQGPDLGVTITGYQPIKFVQDTTASGGQIDRNDRSTCDMPVFRYAEVLLNYAEAKAELGTLTQDDLTVSIDKIRERAGMGGLDMEAANADPDPFLLACYPNVTKSANTGVILEIRRERTVEMVMEGQRMWDMFRWKEGAQMVNETAPYHGIYFPGPGLYDMDGDGKNDLELYATQQTSTPADGLTVLKIGSDIVLSEAADNRGYVVAWNALKYTWNEERDYLWPIPADQRVLTGGLLTQNPGWTDSTNFD